MSEPRYWIVVPAAGVGRRFGGDTPKQYQLLGDKPILVHSLERLMQIGASALVVAINPEDPVWPTLEIARHREIVQVAGGRERADSVLNALRYLEARAAGDDWVLVHDAVRPCVAVSDIQKLQTELRAHAVGGILALPVNDTLKRVDNGSHEILKTEDRQHFRVAQTPQMFRYGLLRQSLEMAVKHGATITDEASAIEQQGLRPLVVEGNASNIKITCREDLMLAEAILMQQRQKED